MMVTLPVSVLPVVHTECKMVSVVYKLFVPRTDRQLSYGLVLGYITGI